MIRFYVTLLILLSFFTPAYAEISPHERMAQTHMEIRAQNLYRAIRCAVCQNQNIADSNADIAKDMRALIRDQILAGHNDDDIIAYLHQRYGDFILMKPPFRLRTALLWCAPLLFMAGGLYLMLRTLRPREGGQA